MDDTDRQALFVLKILDISGSIPRRYVMLTTTPTGPTLPDRIRDRRDSEGGAQGAVLSTTTFFHRSK